MSVVSFTPVSISAEAVIALLAVGAGIFVAGFLLGYRRGRRSQRWFSGDKSLTRR